MEFVPDTLPGEVGCIPQCTSSLCRSLLTAFWIPFFVCETFIFGLTLMKMIRSSGEIQYYSKLIKIFFRDGFIYYFGTRFSSLTLIMAIDAPFEKTALVIMSISVANLLVWILAPISLAYIATSLMRSLQVTAGSRLLLNLRGVINNEYDSTVKSSRMSFQQAETGSSLGGRR
ncbi:transmembrane [Pyrrhoderma noxium]|uniref:Transmembrane n=1 Tax=Pyrrhoderma noxium TaxID=2282107 RepID=A0A286UT87_9AGAM|nr:transmembrane [Pyrrhoderma noxium]